MKNKVFVYREIIKVERRDFCEYSLSDEKNKEAFSLLGLLATIGEDGWELVGEVEGKIIVKKEIFEDEE